MGYFYQREKELEILKTTFEGLTGPKIISIQGVSGSGKTRLIQEFYNSIAKTTKYWKLIDSTVGKKEIEVIPNFQSETEDLNWLFLTTRSIESKGNNYDFSFDRIRQQFSYHLPQIIKTIKNKSKNKKIASSAIGVLLNFSIPGGGHIIDLINLIKDSTTNSIDVLNLISDINERTKEKTAKSQSELYLNEVHNVSQSLFNVLKELYSKNKDFKIVIYLEDFHWIDLYSQQIIKDLFVVANEKDWNILFLISHWPNHIFNKESTESIVLKSFYDWVSTLNKIEQCVFLEINCLNNYSLNKIVKERLPHLQEDAVNILVQRSQGDIDLLNDFIDEIIQSIGWIKDGQLLVNSEKLYELPSKGIEMAKSRLFSYPENIRKHLAWSSLQGIIFDYEIVKSLVDEFDNSLDFLENIKSAEEKYGIIKTKESNILKITGEFKRAVFFEACVSFIKRHPNINDFKLFIIENIQNLINGNKWNELRNEKKTRIIETFSHLIDTTENVKKDSIVTLMKSLLLIGTNKLLIGDYNKSIEICTDVLENTNILSFDIINRTYSILAEGYYYSGEIQKEKEVYKKWEESAKITSYEFHIQYAKFLRRYSRPKESVQIVKQATEKATNIYEKINAEIELVKSLWSNGLQQKAYNKLQEMDTTLIKEITSNEVLEISYYHACCLVLHDLDKNKQVIQYAQKCIDKYERVGNIQSWLISRVNYSDALWSLGYNKSAEKHLRETIELAENYDLPHVKDIAYICYANVLASLNKLESAQIFYQKGILLSEQINHDWDTIYGKVYESVLNLNLNNHGKTDLPALLNRCVESEYFYLADLVFATVCHKGYVQQNLTEINSLKYKPKLPIGNVFFYSTLILTDTYTPEDIDSFISALGKCEGIRLNKKQVVLTINKIINENLVADSILLEFLIRWINVFCNIEEEHNHTIKLKSCDFRSCEARCCYDGVYLQEEEIDKIRDIVRQYPNYFEHLPQDYIVVEKWENLSGQKTATRPHKYKSPDFPDHFNQTRCVFAYEDGACSLQKVSMETTNNPWEYKPLACRIHPLQTNKMDFFSPPSNIEIDKYDLGVGYPGYVSYTQCGMNRNDGNIWTNELESEIDNFTNSN